MGEKCLTRFGASLVLSSDTPTRTHVIYTPIS